MINKLLNNLSPFSELSGGVHPPELKQTRNKPIEKLPPKEKLTVPLSQHIGAPSEPLVEEGEYVKKGQKIGKAQGYISSLVHAPSSGEVVNIDSLPHPSGTESRAIEIEPDEKERTDGDLTSDTGSLSAEELLNKVQEAGIVGMGGAAFPTHVKLNPPENKSVDTFILNGAECEPYLTGDYRLMVEKTEEILKGMNLIAKILGTDNIYIGIEDNKPEALETFRNELDSSSVKEVVSLPSMYPQGWEKSLIYKLTGRKVPTGGLPLDVGVVVNNVATAKAVYDIIYKGKPLIERVVTVAGGVKEPKNLSVRIGTKWRELISECGGLVEGAAKLLDGGPMMGTSQYTDKVPIIKGTTGILVMTESEIENYEPNPCIRCGKCVDVCPMNLIPSSIAQAMQQNQIEKAERLNAEDCCECGSCTYMCPSNISILQWIKQAKEEINLKEKE